MKASADKTPRVFRLSQGDALEVKTTPFGSVGKVFSGEGIEAVWVRKEGEAIDPGWFSQPVVDLILVVQGKLKVEFENHDLASKVLEIGDLLALPSNTRCRAYRWPREAKEPTLFFAVYPVRSEG
jgi:hypothetical protein